MIKTSMIMIAIMRMRENYENDPLADQHKQNCSSLFMCIPRHLGCNGELNCLEGDASDETGCKSTSRIKMMIMMMLTFERSFCDHSIEKKVLYRPQKVM